MNIEILFITNSFDVYNEAKNLGINSTTIYDFIKLI